MVQKNADYINIENIYSKNNYVPKVFLDKEKKDNKNIKEGFSMIKQTNTLIFKNEIFWIIIIIGIFIILLFFYNDKSNSKLVNE